MRKSVIALLVLLVISACSSDNLQNKQFGLQPIQPTNDYRVIETGATGSSSGFMFLFIPVVWPSYADAEKDLLQTVTEQTGRPVALANVVRDHSFFTLLLFSIPTKHVTADVVEFTDNNTAKPLTGSSMTPQVLQGPVAPQQ